MKNKIQFLNEEGSIRGAWIATGITALTFTLFTIAFFWDKGADNLAKISVPLVTCYIGSISMYFLKKLKENGSGR